MKTPLTAFYDFLMVVLAVRAIPFAEQLIVAKQWQAGPAARTGYTSNETCNRYNACHNANQGVQPCKVGIFFLQPDDRSTHVAVWNKNDALVGEI